MIASGAPIYLHYKLRLQSPAIVASVSGHIHGAATQRFIPGAAIRGAMAARLLATGVLGDSADFRGLILSGQVRYLHAYPEIADERALPTPTSWKREKGDPEKVYDLAEYSGDDIDDDSKAAWPTESLSSSIPPFRNASGSAVCVFAARVGSRIHQQRDREKGRSWIEKNGNIEERRGAIYPCEYLEADQVFRGVIQIMPAAATEPERIMSVLNSGPVLVGKSRRAGYGGEAKIEFIGPSKREYENVSESIFQDVPAGKPFRAFLTSAYVGRDPATGQIDPNSLVQELLRRLGQRVEVLRTRWTFETLGGFNQKWRLEVPQASAVAAGALLVLKAPSPIRADTLYGIENDGLGERRIEGFGRVLFLQHSADPRKLILRDELPPKNEPLVQTQPARKKDQEQLALVERRILVAAVRAELDQIAAADIGKKVSGKTPSNSLLGRLRSLFRGVMDEPTAAASLKNLATWCSEGDNGLKEKARRQLKECNVSGSALLNWLKKLGAAGPGESAWKAMLDAVGSSANRLSPIAQTHWLTNEEQAQRRLDEHGAELCVYLIDGVLVALARRNRKKTETIHG